MADGRANLASYSTHVDLPFTTSTIPSARNGSRSAAAGSFSGPSNTAASRSSSSSSIPRTVNLGSDGSNSATPASPPITDCFACKKRRIACDRGLPTCQKCAKKGIPCPGYKKPKIIWKVLKINQVPDTRKYSGGKGNAGETSASRSTGASGPPTRRNQRPQATIRNRTKPPLIDVGFAFKVEPTTSTTPESQEPEGRKSSPEDDEEIETIPRHFDPYIGNVDHLSRDTLTYYHARICMCIEYFKPLRPGPTGLIAPSGTNPLGVLIAEGFSSPLLLNCMLSVAARHRVIIINTEGNTGVQREYDAGRVFTSALAYHGRAVQLMRERVTQQNYLENPTAGRVVEDSGMVTAGVGSGKVSFPKTKQLWEDDSMMMVILLLIYYDMIDGGQGDGVWRNHLEIGKWVIEHREARGLGMGMSGADWAFIRDHLETFDAIGSSFTQAWRIPSQQLWLRPRPGEQPIYDAGPPSPITPTGSPNWQPDTPPHMQPLRSIDDIMNAPDYVPNYPMLLIPRGLWRCMHQISTIRREFAFLKNADGRTSMSLQEICNAHEYILACISAFNPIGWPAPPVPTTASETEYLALGALYQLSLHVYLHMSVTLPLSRSPIAASFGITINPPTTLTPRTTPSPGPNDSDHGGSPPPSEFTTPQHTSTKELLSTLSYNIATHLEKISPFSPAFRSAVWPCMCAGIAAQTVEQVLFARNYMRILSRAMPCLGVTRGYEALERLWAKRAKAGRARRGKTELDGWRTMGEVPSAGLAEGEWDETLDGYEGGIDDWETVVESFKGDWLVI